MDAIAVKAKLTSVRLDGRNFSAVIRPHWPDMARLAHALAPPGQWEDALQEALAAAWRKRSQFDPERGTARNWLLAIVADQARKGFRRVHRHAELVDVAAESNDPVPDLDLTRALQQLSKRQAAVVALYYYIGMPTSEVADVMSCSVSTVKSTLADARKRLRRELGEDYRNE